MKPGRTLFSCAAHQEAKAQFAEHYTQGVVDAWPRTKPAITCDDGRPDGWTEALALAFIATGTTSHCEAFAIAFTDGAWLVVHESWPEFDDFVRSRS